jgi:hypothetical protein
LSRPVGDLERGARLDDGRLIIDLGVRFDAEVGVNIDHRIGKVGERMPRRLPVEVVMRMAWESEIRPNYIGEHSERAFARLEIAHPGEQRVALLDDLEEAVIDVDSVVAAPWRFR